MSLTPQPIRGMSIDPTNPLARGLVGYWPMLEGTGNLVADYSGNGNHGTVSGSGVTWQAGRNSIALAYTASNADTVAIPSQTLTSWTFVLKIKPIETVSSWIIPLGHPIDNSSYWGWSNATYRVHCEGSNVVIAGAGPVSVGTWQYWALTYDGTTLTAYVDGTQLGTPTTNNNRTFVVDSIGRGFNSLAPGIEIDHAVIYDRALVSSEIATLYADPWALFRRKVVIPKEEPPPEPSDVIVVKQRVQPVRGMSIDRTNPLARGLIGYWPMLDGTGNVVADYSGQNNQGQMQNMDPATDWVPGRYGTALNFATATNEYVDFGNPYVPANLQHGLTVSAWARVTDGTTAQLILEDGTAYNTNSFFLSAEPTNRFLFLVMGQTHHNRYSDANVYTTGEWCHVACVWAPGSNVEIYVNGVASTQPPEGPAQSALRNGNATLQLGRRPNSTAVSYTGDVANVAIYDRVFSPFDVVSLYNDFWALFRRRTVVPAEQPPAYDIQGSNAYGSDQISFNWTVNPA